MVHARIESQIRDTELSAERAPPNNLNTYLGVSLLLFAAQKQTKYVFLLNSIWASRWIIRFDLKRSSSRSNVKVKYKNTLFFHFFFSFKDELNIRIA